MPDSCHASTNARFFIVCDEPGLPSLGMLIATLQEMAYAVFGNYLNVCGRLGEFENYAPRGTFTPSQLESLMVFG